MRKLEAGQAPFLDDCYKRPAHPPEFTFDGPLKYACTICDIGSHGYGVGFTKVRGAWTAVQVIDYGQHTGRVPAAR